MKLHTRLILILGAIITIGGAIRDASAERAAKYRIAVIIPLSGNVASLGNYVKNGIDLSHGALPQQLRDRISLVYEDDQFEPIKTVAAYRKLAATGGTDAVFVVGSPPANALGPILEKEGKILIAIGASDPSIAVGKQYSFIHWVIPSVLGDALAAELSNRNMQKIGFVSAEASGTIADMNAAISSLKERDLSDRIVYTQTFSKDETDYRTAIQKLRQKRVDAIVAILFPGALSSFAKQLRSANMRAELVGMETFEDEDEVKAADGALDGAWYVTAADSSERFVNEYISRYGSHPGWGAANGYDALQLVAEAVAQGKRTSDEVKESLRSVKNHSGAAGQYSSSGDNRFTLPAALKKIQGESFVDFRHDLDR